jgi:hypothetical protein
VPPAQAATPAKSVSAERVAAPAATDTYTVPVPRRALAFGLLFSSSLAQCTNAREHEKGTASMNTTDTVRRVAAGALGLALLSLGATASAQQAVVVDGDGDSPRGPNAFLFSSGLVTTGLSYTPALIVAVNSDRSEDKYLYAPFVGPWLDLATRDDDSKMNRTLLVVDGVFQTIGALQLIASLMFVDTGHHDVAATKEGIDVASVAPARLSEDGYGLVAVGSF